jgi:tetratricopeptide (TPR) repeat protein
LWPLSYETLEQRAFVKKELSPAGRQEGELRASSEALAIGKAAVLDQFIFLLQPQLISGRAMQFKNLYNGPARSTLGREKKFKQTKEEQEAQESSDAPTAQQKKASQGPEGAKQAFMNARPSENTLNEATRNPAMQQPYEMARQIAPRMLGLNAFTPADFPPLKTAYDTAKQNASFWLGIIAYDEGHYDVAIDYFLKRTIEAYPDGPWTAAAQYNLARCYEKIAQPEKAIKLYEDDDSPQRHGNLLRARRLRTEQDTAKAEKPAATP